MGDKRNVWNDGRGQEIKTSTNRDTLLYCTAVLILLILLSRWDSYFYLGEEARLRPWVEEQGVVATNYRHLDPLLRAMVEDSKVVGDMVNQGLVLKVTAPCRVRVLGRVRRDGRADAVRIKLAQGYWDQGGWVSPVWLE